MKKIVITVPKLHLPGGVSAYWNAILPQLANAMDCVFAPLEIGGHGKNIIGPVWDQRKVYRACKTADLMLFNPSLGARSFFRDGFFAKQAVAKKVPFVVFFHGWDLDFEQKVTQDHTSFFRNSFGKASCIIVLSAGFQEKLREWGYEGRVVVGTTTIDPALLDTFSAEDKIQALRKAPSLKILFLSRLVKEKGIYETLKAFQTLRKAYPTAELVVAGDGPEYANLCMQTAHMEGVTLTGHVAGNEKNELLSTSHIYCLPSYTEGLPTSVLEAMAFGIPVVTTAVGGLRDFFKDPEMGSFVDLEKPGDLADKLGQLLANKDRRLAVGKFNLKFAQAHLMAPTIALRLKALCMESMGTPAPRKEKVK